MQQHRQDTRHAAIALTLEASCKDEARVGQQTKLTRRWAKRGTRPSAPKDQRRSSAWLFGAICPAEGKAAGIVKKALESAIANAEHNDGADIDELKVTSIYVEQGATLKRFSARAKGRGNRISKPTCHIYVTVGN